MNNGDVFSTTTCIAKHVLLHSGLDGSDEVTANCESNNNTNPEKDDDKTSEGSNSDDSKIENKNPADDNNTNNFNSDDNSDDNKNINTENDNSTKPSSSRTDQAINSTIWMFLLTIPRIFC